MGKYYYSPVYRGWKWGTRDQNNVWITLQQCDSSLRCWTPLDTTFINPILIWMGKLRTRWRELHAGLDSQVLSDPTDCVLPMMPQGPGQRDRLPIQKHLHRLHETPPVTSPFLLPEHPFRFLSSNPTVSPSLLIPAQEWPPVWNVSRWVQPAMVGTSSFTLPLHLRGQSKW